MICRHAPGDPNCSSSPQGRARLEAEYARKRELHAHANKELQEENKRLRATVDNQPDAENYGIVEFQRVGDHVVMRVNYPSCAKCAYEGNKIMVFLNVSEADVIQWKRIDPHFRDPDQNQSKTSAPPPAARFPGDDDGWEDAIAYAKSKGVSNRMKHLRS